MTVWGTYSNGDYGWNRAGHQPKDVLNPWWQYAWNQGPELVALMLDRWDYMGDDAYLTGQILPMAESVLKYFDTRFKKDGNGRIVLDPTQAVETYWHGVKNDMPSTAGLNDITAPVRLAGETHQCAAASVLPEDACRLSRRTGGGGRGRRQEGPPPCPGGALCRGSIELRKPRALRHLALPALRPWQTRLGRTRAAYTGRHNHLDIGWGYDGNCAALLGLTGEAARILKVKWPIPDPAYRWPATWGPNFDWLPDQNHGGNLLETTQLMLLQPVGDKILLLPAWPKAWDVDFQFPPRGIRSSSAATAVAKSNGSSLRRSPPRGYRLSARWIAVKSVDVVLASGETLAPNRFINGLERTGFKLSLNHPATKPTAPHRWQGHRLRPRQETVLPREKQKSRRTRARTSWHFRSA